MGILADIKAIKDVQKLKNGEIVKLSISQITGLITNMTDAKKNLEPKKFQDIYKLFTELRTCNTKMEMNLEEYYRTAKDIIKRFDIISPYEKYSGGNEFEFSFLMNEIRNENDSKRNIVTDLSQEDKEYTKVIMRSGMIDQDEANDFIQILHIYVTEGKDKTLENFEILKDKIIEKSGAIESIKKISFLLGLLNSNGIIDEYEMNNLRDSYQRELMAIIMKNNK